MTTLIQVDVGHYSSLSNGKEPLGDPLCNNDLVDDMIYVITGNGLQKEDTSYHACQLMVISGN